MEVFVFKTNVTTKNEIIAISQLLDNTLTRWVQLNDLNFNIIYWSAKDKFVHVLYQC